MSKLLRIIFLVSCSSICNTMLQSIADVPPESGTVSTNKSIKIKPVRETEDADIEAEQVNYLNLFIRSNRNFTLTTATSCKQVDQFIETVFNPEVTNLPGSFWELYQKILGDKFQSFFSELNNQTVLADKRLKNVVFSTRSAITFIDTIGFTIEYAAKTNLFDDLSLEHTKNKLYEFKQDIIDIFSILLQFDHNIGLIAYRSIKKFNKRTPTHRILNTEFREHNLRKTIRASSQFVDYFNNLSATTRSSLSNLVEVFSDASTYVTDTDSTKIYMPQSIHELVTNLVNKFYETEIQYKNLMTKTPVVGQEISSDSDNKKKKADDDVEEVCTTMVKKGEPQVREAKSEYVAYEENNISAFNLVTSYILTEQYRTRERPYYIYHVAKLNRVMQQMQAREKLEHISKLLESNLAWAKVMLDKDIVPILDTIIQQTPLMGSVLSTWFMAEYLVTPVTKYIQRDRLLNKSTSIQNMPVKLDETSYTEVIDNSIRRKFNGAVTSDRHVANYCSAPYKLDFIFPLAEYKFELDKFRRTKYGRIENLHTIKKHITNKGYDKELIDISERKVTCAELYNLVYSYSTRFVDRIMWAGYDRQGAKAILGILDEAVEYPQNWFNFQLGSLTSIQSAVANVFNRVNEQKPERSEQLVRIVKSVEVRNQIVKAAYRRYITPATAFKLKKIKWPRILSQDTPLYDVKIKYRLGIKDVPLGSLPPDESNRDPLRIFVRQVNDHWTQPRVGTWYSKFLQEQQARQRIDVPYKALRTFEGRAFCQVLTNFRADYVPIDFTRRFAIAEMQAEARVHYRALQDREKMRKQQLNDKIFIGLNLLIFLIPVIVLSGRYMFYLIKNTTLESLIYQFSPILGVFKYLLESNTIQIGTSVYNSNNLQTGQYTILTDIFEYFYAPLMGVIEYVIGYDNLVKFITCIKTYLSKAYTVICYLIVKIYFILVINVQIYVVYMPDLLVPLIQLSAIMMQYYLSPIWSNL